MRRVLLRGEVPAFELHLEGSFRWCEVEVGLHVCHDLIQRLNTSQSVDGDAIWDTYLALADVEIVAHIFVNFPLVDLKGVMLAAIVGLFWYTGSP